LVALALFAEFANGSGKNRLMGDIHDSHTIPPPRLSILLATADGAFLDFADGLVSAFCLAFTRPFFTILPSWFSPFMKMKPPCSHLLGEGLGVRGLQPST